MTTSVDFDYNGPPVCVSNGMALQLVSQFGIRNAWHAFLRMRGKKVNCDESNRAVDSFKYFRNKIGWLRHKMQKGSRLEGEERVLEQLLSENFDTFLYAQNSLELRKGILDYPEVGESEFDEEKSEAEGKIKDGQINVLENEVGTIVGAYQSTETAAIALLKVIKEQQQRKLNQPSDGKTESSSLLNSEEKEKDKLRKTPAAKEPREKLLQKGGKNEQQLQDEHENAVTRRHAETIDDVVSLVLEKIRRNQPFEGELNMTSVSSVAQPQRFTQTTGGHSKGQKGSAEGQRPMTAFVTGYKRRQNKEEEAFHGGGAQQQKQHLYTRTTNFSSMPSAGQSLFFLHSPSNAQSISSHQLTTPSSIVQQPIGQTEAQLPMATIIRGSLSSERGIHLDLAIQRGMTVQELIQMQNKCQQLFSSQNQLLIQKQETPDSSSIQQEGQKLEGTTKIKNISRKRKKLPSAKKGEELKKTRGEKDTLMAKRGLTKQQQQQQTTKTMGGEGRRKKEQTEEEKERTEQRLCELEGQLKKAKKQVMVEQNKVIGQKRRADKLQTELDKSLDAIQLLQIDLACLKTDNNSLIAENIALKAENQQLRLKRSTSIVHKKRGPCPSSSAKEQSDNGAGAVRREREKAIKGGEKALNKKQQCEKACLPEKTRTPPPLSSELGRRQSKRICVARSQFTKKFY